MTIFDFLSGSITLGFLIAGLFFLRFWRRTNDTLFLAFAAAFSLLGVGQAIQALANIPQEERSYIFLIRLAAFTIILAAFVAQSKHSLLPRETVEACHVRYCADVSETVRDLVEQARAEGRRGSVLVLPHGQLTVPVIG